jgi:serine/threonine-protein kinase
MNQSPQPDNGAGLPPAARYVDQICDRFEDAWRAGQRPRVEEFLRDVAEPERSALRHELLLVLVHYLRIEQRHRWQQGERVSVREYLREAPELHEEPELVFELICDEVLLRQERNDTSARPEDYLDLLPCHEAQLRHFFADRQTFVPATRNVASGQATQQRSSGVETLAGAGRPGEPDAPSLDRYQPGGFIGRGGMGDVFWVHDPHMGRDLAVKVLREDRRQAHLERRFLEEARINSRLQHPGVVPVHELGETLDGRPFFTMKLIKGRTLADLLKDRAGLVEDLPRFLGVFEQVCQAVAYAHAQGVIHRDLKPHNVMVGAFGEVQVMDWGLAKALGRTAEGGVPSAAQEPPAPAALGDTVDEVPGTLPGEVMGTPAYMAPEQARGEGDRVDERSDVFGLGAMLCRILTGKPPFTGRDTFELFAKARACDHAEAIARLDGCGADTDLLQLAKTCLAAEPANRPANAGAVTREVTTYLAGVQERLRAAERERAAAQARAEEARKTAAAERRARRRMVWAALAVLLLVLGASGGAWWQQRKQEQADQAVMNGLAQAELLEGQAQEAPLEPGKHHQALEAAQVAAHLAEGGASVNVRGRAEELVARLKREDEAAGRDRQLLARVLEVHGSREGPKYRLNDKGMMMEMAEPTAEEQFASAFRAWGLNVDSTPTAEAVACLKARPAAVVTEVIAALDEWASQRRGDRKSDVARNLAALAAALEDNPGSLRRELREILVRESLPVERALGVLSAALRPVPIPLVVPLGEDHARLRRLAEKIDPASEPVLGLLTLTRALRVAGEEALAERLLREALTARPREVVLYHTLGELLTEQEPPRWAEAVECYTAARALRPDLGVALARSLRRSGRTREGMVLLARLVRERPDNPYLHFQQGVALDDQGKIALNPDLVKAYYDLGVALDDQGKYAEAEAAYRQAIVLNPDLALAYINLGNALNRQGEPVETEAAHRQATARKPDLVQAYYNLSVALDRQGKYAEAAAACRQGIALKPDFAEAYNNLKPANADDALGKYPEAAAKYAEEAAACRHKQLHAGAARLYADAFDADWKRFSVLQPQQQSQLVQVRSAMLLALGSGAFDDAFRQGKEPPPADGGDTFILADAVPAHLKSLFAVLELQHRYDAARSAALAAAGQGEDARLLPDKVRAMFRRLALGWLRDHLTAYAKLAGQNNPQAKQAIRQRLLRWQSDPDLASVRDRAALDRLADNERAAWQALWRDVDDLAKQVANKDDEEREKLKETKNPKKDSRVKDSAGRHHGNPRAEAGARLAKERGGRPGDGWPVPIRHLINGVDWLYTEALWRVVVIVALLLVFSGIEMVVSRLARRTIRRT